MTFCVFDKQLFLQGVTRGYLELSRRVTGGDKGLQEVYRGLQGVTAGEKKYRGLTKGLIRGLKGVTGGDKGLPGGYNPWLQGV